MMPIYRVAMPPMYPKWMSVTGPRMAAWTMMLCDRRHMVRHAPSSVWAMAMVIAMAPQNVILPPHCVRHQQSDLVMRPDRNTVANDPIIHVLRQPDPLIPAQHRPPMDLDLQTAMMDIVSHAQTIQIDPIHRSMMEEVTDQDQAHRHVHLPTTDHHRRGTNTCVAMAAGTAVTMMIRQYRPISIPRIIFRAIKVSEGIDKERGCDRERKRSVQQELL